MAGSLTVKFEKPVFKAFINGYLNAELSEELFGRFQQSLQEGAKIFCFDFSKVDIVNSVALSRLLDIISDGISDDSLEFFFVGVPSECRFGFDAIGLFAYVKEYKTVEEFDSRN